jgi:uncharacterized membrane protein YgdD (TMEM256/DUF423 family)
MVVLVNIVGIVLVVMGVVVLVRPGILKSWLSFWQQGNRLQLAVLIRLVIGSVFVTAAPRCHVPGVILIVGIVVFGSGIVGLILGPERLRSIAQWYGDRPARVQRAWALLTMGLGAVVLYAS